MKEKIEIDWDKIEELCVDLAADCLPKNVREWSYFIEMYENALKYYNGEGHDFCRKDMTEDEHTLLVNQYMYLGRTFKRSPFECFNDLNRKDKKIFKGVNWTAINLVYKTWCNWNITLHDLGLETLPKCPEYVGGYFWCNSNRLTTLQGAPQHVGAYFFCANNQLTTLQGAPQHVGGDFSCGNNKLTTLQGAPQYVGKDFSCHDNQLTSLEGAPQHVGGYFWCRDNQLTTLQGAPEHVGGDFYCVSNQLPKSIPTDFPGKDLPKYIDLKESIILNFKDFNKKSGQLFSDNVKW